VIGSILTSTYSSHVNLAALSSQIAAKVKASYAVASQLGPLISDRAHTAFVGGMNVALLTAAGAALVAAIGAVLLLAHRFRNSAAREPEDTAAAPVAPSLS
jgi:hypothetical protein